KIQHRIIAVALGRSVTSVSKKIKTLGLRLPSLIRGRLKGNKNDLPWVEKVPLDLTKMKDILQTYAPLKYSQKGQLALSERCWVPSKSLSPKALMKGECIGTIAQENPSFSFSPSLDYILSKN